MSGFDVVRLTHNTAVLIAKGNLRSKPAPPCAISLGVTGLAPEAYLDQLVEFYAQACAPIGAGATDVGDVAGYPFASKVLLCGRNRQTGQGSVMLFKVIRGREALYAVTRAWRGAAFDLESAPISRGELADWAYYLAGARLCDLASAEAPCRAP